MFTFCEHFNISLIDLTSMRSYHQGKESLGRKNISEEDFNYDKKYLYSNNRKMNGDYRVVCK
jgi:hypothetical protein